MKEGVNYDIVTATTNLRKALEDYYQFNLNLFEDT